MNFKCQNCGTRITVPEKVVQVKGIDEFAILFCPSCDYPEPMEILNVAGGQPCPIVENCLGMECLIRSSCVHLKSPVIKEET